MMNKKLLVLLSVFALTATTPVFAASSDVLSKLQEIQQSQDNAPGPILQPDTTPPADGIIDFPTAAEVKAEIGDQASAYKADWKAQADAGTDAAAVFKYGVACEESGDLTGAMAALQIAIGLAPAQQETYRELATLYQTEYPHTISVFLNGVKLQFDTEPTLIDNRTLVPISRIADKLGAVSSWNGTKHTATIRLLDTEVELVQDSKQAFVNQQAVLLDVSARNINNRIYVPLRFISEQLLKTVDYYNSANGTLIVSIKDQP